MSKAKKVNSISVNMTNLKRYHEQRNVIQNTAESTLNYGIIRIMTDMDPDGNDIQCLLLQFFSHWPQLFLQGRIRRLNTPLFVARKKKKPTQYFYTFDEYEKAKSELKGYEVEYMKGLGSLHKEDYSVAINSPRDTMLIMDTDAKDSLDMAFGSDSQLRKDWLTQEN